MQTKHIALNSPRAWWLAARPKTLAGAALPVVVAGALAYHDAQAPTALFLIPHAAWVWGCCLCFACLMQIAANLINDFYDYLYGSDREDRLGPDRAFAQGWVDGRGMQIAIVVVITLACLFGLAALWLTHTALSFGGWELVGLGMACILFAFLYTIYFSYVGLGDLLVIVFFGLVPVCATHYLLTLHTTLQALSAALACGFAIDALLVVNNYRDRDQDRKSHKLTVVVRYGEPFGRYLYLVTGLLATGFLLAIDLRLLPAAAAYLFLHYASWRKLCRLREGRALNQLLGETSRNMLCMALLTAVTFLIC